MSHSVQDFLSLSLSLSVQLIPVTEMRQQIVRALKGLSGFSQSRGVCLSVWLARPLAAKKGLFCVVSAEASFNGDTRRIDICIVPLPRGAQPGMRDNKGELSLQSAWTS